MKFIHIADLHLGKRLKERSLLEDQSHALGFIILRARESRPDAIFIAGDVYDRPQPPTEAVALLDWFLTELTSLGIRVFMIGGNHDSKARLAFASSILSREGVHIAGEFDGTIECVTVPDGYGDVCVWLLPHIMTREAARFFNFDFEPNLTDVIRRAIAESGLDPDKRNIILAHQFITAAGDEPETSDSEINPVGGLDSADAGAFGEFSYVALGHLHGAQRIGRDVVRYAGSPVRYSFSEARQKKSFVEGEIDGDGGVTFELVPIPQLHGMRLIEGPIDELVLSADGSDDYLRATLTDNPPPVNPLERLSDAYENVLELILAPGGIIEITGDAPQYGVDDKDDLELFSDFYLKMTGQLMSAESEKYIAELLNGLVPVSCII